MPKSAYNSSANKAMSNMRKQYGSNWKKVYYALANKRTGGVKGKNRGSRSANIAFAKGSHWTGTRSRGRVTRSRTRLKG